MSRLFSLPARGHRPSVSRRRMVNGDYAMVHDDLDCATCGQQMELPVVQYAYMGRQNIKTWYCLSCNTEWVGSYFTPVIQELP